MIGVSSVGVLPIIADPAWRTAFPPRPETEWPFVSKSAHVVAAAQTRGDAAACFVGVGSTVHQFSLLLPKRVGTDSPTETSWGIGPAVAPLAVASRRVAAVFVDDRADFIRWVTDDGDLGVTPASQTVATDVDPPTRKKHRVERDASLPRNASVASCSLHGCSTDGPSLRWLGGAYAPRPMPRQLDTASWRASSRRQCGKLLARFMSFVVGCFTMVSINIRIDRESIVNQSCVINIIA
jgi:hypothetical protein